MIFSSVKIQRNLFIWLSLIISHQVSNLIFGLTKFLFIIIFQLPSVGALRFVWMLITFSRRQLELSLKVIVVEVIVTEVIFAIVLLFLLFSHLYQSRLLSCAAWEEIRSTTAAYVSFVVGQIKNRDIDLFLYVQISFSDSTIF